MSITAIAWLASVGALALASLFRAPYGFSLYLLTFYLFPTFWWWGRALPDLRWNLSAGLVFLIAVVLQATRTPNQAEPDAGSTRVTNIALAILANATLVHVLLAPSLQLSMNSYLQLLKFVVLFFLIINCIRNPRDLRLVLWSIILGAAYLGFEVTFNNRGRILKGRLEGVGAAGVDNANQLASLLVTVLPLAGGLFFWGKRWDKLFVAVTGPLILNVVLLCNSRGAFLAAIAGAISLLLTTTGAVRKQVLYGIGLAGLATFLLLGDARIVERFTTTFSSAEERDGSAAGRIVLWKAGLKLILANPLGSGGDIFKRGHAAQYLAEGGVDREGRSVHNGFLNEAGEWGFQGFALRLLFMGLAVVVTRKTLIRQSELRSTGEAALGCCLIASIVTFVVSCTFGDYMDDEWGYWVTALMVSYARLFGGSIPETAAVQVPSAPTGLGRQLSPSAGVQRSRRMA